MTKIINEKFGISVDYEKDNNNNYFKVRFYDSNDKEFNAYIMDEYKDYQLDIINDIKQLSNEANCFNDLINFFESNGFNIKLTDFIEEDDNNPIYTFGDYKIQVMY